ncbi:MAG: hypothetical protein CYPHOPRED_005026 [Cyphobasidiales sp. Tagirdzhanova-0007]|nr:MAG: hypothetical protein CYPHOPRED_005026 [Cyphobasidiales sp. Tagirdzhanova-0007]
MSPASPPSTNHCILIIDHPREMPESELDDFKKEWSGKGVKFLQYDLPKEAPFPSKSYVFDQLRKLDQEAGPIDGCVSFCTFISSYQPINADFCETLPSLGLLAGTGAGFDRIDIDAFSKHSVYYCNTPKSFSKPTADSASVLILAVLKNTIIGDRTIRAGKWQENMPKGLNPKGATLGILGMGTIGGITCKQMQAFGMKVVYHNRKRLPEDREEGATFVPSLSEFLKQCDVVSVHVPLNASSRHLLSAKEFAMFKTGARLVNTARGSVVDEQALVEALQSGKLSGAGLDVFENEPDVHPWLVESDNVLLTPHIAGDTLGTVAEAMREILQSLSSYLSIEKGQPPLNAVNQIEPRKSRLNIWLRFHGH